ncbi:uncharacterized protein LOC122847826 [Aphidius gifuensis]|uniref:uncharacterized protein LOC122847826 n=1 Tax=Aphidius gifuensis TaxID=684658 RepID=UPI001CDC20A8|nr:uncharacterized protein LOC122847826 [Aphidius gifuensis]
MANFYVYYSLIQGVRKQEPRKMYLWIYLTYISLIIGAIFIVLSLIVLFVLAVSEKSMEYGLGFISLFLIMAILAGLFYYGFSSVVTHCQDLILIQSGQQILTP